MSQRQQMISGKYMHTASLFPSAFPNGPLIFLIRNNFRMNNPNNLNCKRETMNLIELAMRQNPYARSFKNMQEVIEADPTNAPNVKLLFTRSTNDDQRRYNAPTMAEVSVVFVGDDGGVPTNIDLKVYPNNPNQTTILNKNSRHVDPMTFPLLFPTGEFGWTINMKQANPTARHQNITPIQFYAYKRAIRPNDFNAMFYSNKLFQQYAVHTFIIAESNRLDWLRNNQRALRVENYQGLVDALLQGNEGERVGNLCILPSTYVGSPRYMHQNYQDAMAIVNKFGQPDLFITMTCNPAWSEIMAQLKPGQTAYDRPDVIVRVFELKMQYWLSLMLQFDFCGKVIAHTYTVEFQKRGLPHIHAVFTFAERDKLRTAEDIDSVISAEIPTESEPELRAIVLKHMIHGPHTATSTCLRENGVCEKKFPKKFCDFISSLVRWIATESHFCFGGYPSYKRRNNSNELIQCRGSFIDNSFVVPYNRGLSLLLNCHINVEAVATIQCIKYIFKYINKGHDRVRIQ
jgi:Helitron helicase-like domain at N-terminus